MIEGVFRSFLAETAWMTGREASFDDALVVLLINMNKRFWLAAVVVGLFLPGARADDVYGSVDTFYGYITGVANDAGYNTGALPANPSLEYKTAVAAYFWGYPLETTYRSQLAFLNSHGLAVNTLYAPGVIDLSTTVEAPDVNVLYTSGFLNLAGNTAYVLSVPDTVTTANPAGTYNVMEIVNAYSATTSSVGTRNFTTSAVSNAGGNYLMVGPTYDTSQALPEGITSYIQSETAQSWLVGRMAFDYYATATLPNGDPTPYNIAAGGVNSSLSQQNSAPLAQAYSVTSLADYLAGETTPAIISSSPTAEQQAIAEANAQTKTGQEYFQYVGNSVAQNGVPNTTDNNQAVMYDNFSVIGLTNSGYTPPSAEVQQQMNQAAADAAAMLAAMGDNTAALPGGGATATGWTVNTSLGEYAASYNGWVTAAVTGFVGTIANLAVDGTYPQTSQTADGQQLNGSTNYTISFAAGDLPPVNGFWSVTLYDMAGNIVENTGNTYYGDNVYAIGSMQMAVALGDALDTTPVTLYLQSEAPTDLSLMPFWLPTPEGQDFELIMRMYFPDSTDPSILNGTYAVPAVVQAVPEPSAVALVVLAIALGMVARRRWVGGAA